MQVDSGMLLMVDRDWQDPEPAGHGPSWSHQYRQCPFCGVPDATQASRSPHGAGPPIAAQASPAPAGPDFMHSQALPSTDQQVCPAGQSYLVAQP
jgi:hypothetical protein